MSIKLNSIAQPKAKPNKQQFDFSFLNKKKTKVNNKRNALFFQELSILLSSGVDIKTGLEIIINSSTKKKDTELYSKIRTNLVEGESLSNAIKKTKAFTNFDYYNIQIGEETGNIIESMELLYAYHNGKLENIQKIKTALTYPGIVLVFALVAVLIMLKFIVPVFSDVYSRFNQELPGLTKSIINLSENLGRGISYIVLLAVIVIGFLKYASNNINLKRKLQQLSIRVPFIGAFYLNVQLGMLFHSLSILIKAKVNIVKSLGILKKMTSFLPLVDALTDIQNDLLIGLSFSAALKKHSNLFNNKHVAIIKVGEEVNRLEYVIEKVRLELGKKTQNILDNLSTLIEPLLIILVGLLVGVILISMYLPMFQMSSTFL